MRGRGAAGKVPVFGLLKRTGKVYAKVIPDAKSKTLMNIMAKRIVPDSIVNFWFNKNFKTANKKFLTPHLKLFFGVPNINIVRQKLASSNC